MKIPKVPNANAAYHQALGAFIEMYANAEAAAQMTLWHLSGIELTTARAIWPSMRLKTVTDNLRKIHRARNKPMDENLEEALSHFVTINNIRDDLIHYGSQLDDAGNRFTTNAYQAVSPELAVRSAVSTQLLNTLLIDLQTIIWRLMAHLPPSDQQYQPQHLECIRLAQTPLLYKSPQPESKSRETRKDARKRPPRPSASPR